ncbi:class I SAM-dependent DNA methyltransferase [Rhodoligotrophos defluvii]|uniref:class I SAM-dependent DNA methyltransferase n=1 Tax=Rhodoligotrophos defluvii TaxID=2561934 RepID=UPI0010C9C8F6|nr:class I SAM-dependent methyltransferase [Rhodoligotrophos defluvii]
MQRNRTDTRSGENARGAPSQPEADSSGTSATASRSDEFLARSYSMAGPEDAVTLYRDWAASYDQQLETELHYLSPAGVAALAAAWLPDRTVPMLDIGCGTGLTAAAARAHGFTTIDGVDISPEMLALARMKGIYRALFEADLTRPLDLPSSAYGAAISSGTFTHAHVGAVAFDEIFRVLRPGGLLVCTIHAHVFEPSGFRDKIAALSEAGVMAIRHRHEAPLFADAPAEGLYFVFERRHG